MAEMDGLEPTIDRASKAPAIAAMRHLNEMVDRVGAAPTSRGLRGRTLAS